MPYVFKEETFKSYRKFTKQKVLELQEKANNGNLKAQFIVARCYQFGFGVEQDTKTSQDYSTLYGENQYQLAQQNNDTTALYKAVKENNQKALYKLGIIFLKGETPGFTQNINKGIYYLEDAANFGSSDAIAALYKCGALSLIGGAGFIKDTRKALDLLKKAAHLGSENAITVLRKIQDECTQRKAVAHNIVPIPIQGKSLSDDAPLHPVPEKSVFILHQAPMREKTRVHPRDEVEEDSKENRVPNTAKRARKA